MPRTTLNIDPHILGELRKRAHQEQRSLGDVVSELLGDALRERSDPKPREPFKWPSRDMGARIPMEDWSAVKEFLNAEDVAAYLEHREDRS